MKLLAILSVFTTLLILGICLSRTADSLLAKRGDDAERVFRDTLAAKR